MASGRVDGVTRSVPKRTGRRYTYVQEQSGIGELSGRGRAVSMRDRKKRQALLQMRRRLATPHVQREFLRHLRGDIPDECLDALARAWTEVAWAIANANAVAGLGDTHERR